MKLTHAIPLVAAVLLAGCMTIDMGTVRALQKLDPADIESAAPTRPIATRRVSLIFPSG